MPTTELIPSLQTSFIDAQVPSRSDLRSQLLINDPSRNVKVRTAIVEELSRCDRFDMSVAFVTYAGINAMLMTLQTLNARHVPGRFLTTDYEMFSQPRALRALMSLDNIEVRMYRCRTAGGDGFHTKGYLFGDNEAMRLIIGSSNMTAQALTTNREWNARIVTHRDGEFARAMQDEFEAMWNHPQTVPAETVIDAYEQAFEQAQQARRDVKEARQLKAATQLETQKVRPTPNSMQREVVANVLKIKNAGHDRALLISATGTGKTYASAFAVQALKPRRVLFVVHREQIARQAMAAYRRVLGEDYTYGVVSGTSKEFDADFTFSTVQTMVKCCQELSPATYDAIVIDEVHRAGAQSYQTIMEHFKPAFWFGMTASPERTDDFDIYGLFDYQIAHEIRLQEALSEDLLCPFHYFGITDITAGDDVIDEERFLQINVKERVRLVMQQADYFGYSGTRVRGLIFCASVAEAERISWEMNQNGLRTLALSGADTQQEREAAVQRLVGDGPDALDYLLTVDIFNEGVDIPEINQVILLRETESPIVFVQQLGRGLRKAKNKEFVVVLDFIAGYKRNYLIPVALSGDRSYNKDQMRRFVSTQKDLIPGASSIQFDPIARERIFNAIDNASTHSISLLRKAYKDLSLKINRCPMLMDFERYGTVDPTKFFENKSVKSYYGFLAGYEKTFTERWTPAAVDQMEYLCVKLGMGKRITEIVMLEEALRGTKDIVAVTRRRVLQENQCRLTQQDVDSALKVLTGDFHQTAAQKAKMHRAVFLAKSPDTAGYEAASIFTDALNDRDFNPSYRAFVQDLLALMRYRWETYYARAYKETALTLYQTYTYEDVARLLNWPVNPPAQNIGGYLYNEATRTMPIFVNYEKTEDAIGYEDRFICSNEIVTLSKTGRKVDSLDADRMFKRTAETADTRLYLFVRKNKDDKEAKAFYFLGEIQARGTPEPVVLENKKNAFEVHFQLQDAVRSDIYQYLTGE